MENKLLQSVLGSLEQSQSKDQFVKNLEKIKASLEKINKAAIEDDASILTQQNDEYAEERKQAKAGEVLIERNGQRGFVPENEVLPTDKLL